MRINVGDCVLYTTFGGHTGAAEIESIEITNAEDSKYGYTVPSTDTQYETNGLVCLSDGHWCYFDQINQVLSYA